MPNQTRVVFALNSSVKDKASFAKLVKETFEPSTFAFQLFLGVYACEWRLYRGTDLAECLWDGHTVSVVKLSDYLAVLGCEFKIGYAIDGEPIEDGLDEEDFWGQFFINEGGSLRTMKFTDAQETSGVHSDSIDDVFDGLVALN